MLGSPRSNYLTTIDSVRHALPSAQSLSRLHLPNATIRQPTGLTFLTRASSRKRASIIPDRAYPFHTNAPVKIQSLNLLSTKAGSEAESDT